ncbi:MAG: hypothetical protein CSA89_01295 [Bacteroidales bacterium]|nr:MAG: hypothetical protein CSA89_01295 [Bacteroidales bacterium]
MATYKSNTIINRPKEAIYKKISDLKNLEQTIAQKSQTTNGVEKIQELDLTFAEDSIKFKIPQMGYARLQIIDRKEDSIKFTLKDIPLTADININLNAIEADKTDVEVLIDADIPFFLKHLIGNKLQNGIDTITKEIGKAFDN